MKIFDLKNRSTLYYFDGIRDLNNLTLDTQKQISHCMSDIKRNTINKWQEKYWYGDSLKNVRKYIKEGWSKGADDINNIIETFEIPPLPSLKREMKYKSNGMSLNPNKAYNGSLKPWKKMVRERQSNSFARKSCVTLCVNIGGNVGVSAGELFWNGAVAFKLSQALINTGRMVRIIVTDISIYPTRDMYFACCIKDFESSCDPGTLAFATAHAGFFRYLAFRCMHHFAPGSSCQAGIINPNDGLYPILGNSAVISIEQIRSKRDAVDLLKDMAVKFSEQRKGYSYAGRYAKL